MRARRHCSRELSITGPHELSIFFDDPGEWDRIRLMAARIRLCRRQPALEKSAISNVEIPD